MSWGFVAILMVMTLPAQAAALLSDQPLCFTVENKSGREIMGLVETDRFTDANGIVRSHQNTFRLDDTKTQPFCSTGPFFDGYTLRLVIKASAPLYSCKTQMNRVVTVTAARDALGFTTLVADCPSEHAPANGG